MVTLTHFSCLVLRVLFQCKLLQNVTESFITICDSDINDMCVITKCDKRYEDFRQILQNATLLQ